ncbi:MAG: hypothetical protein ACOC2J_03825, partial [bacterium]
MELEVPNIFYGKYEDYYENGQLKREILPYNGNLQGWTYNRGKRINIKDGKIVYYNQNGEHDETRIYIN